MTPLKGTPFNSIDFETIKNKWVYDVRNYRKLLIKPLQMFHSVGGGDCLSVLIITVGGLGQVMIWIKLV